VEVLEWVAGPSGGPPLTFTILGGDPKNPTTLGTLTLAAPGSSARFTMPAAPPAPPSPAVVPTPFPNPPLKGATAPRGADPGVAAQLFDNPSPGLGVAVPVDGNLVFQPYQAPWTPAPAAAVANGTPANPYTTVWLSLVACPTAPTSQDGGGSYVFAAGAPGSCPMLAGP
jgi:hypothetical protein